MVIKKKEEKMEKSSKFKIYNEKYKCYYYEENPNVCYKIEENDNGVIWISYVFLIIFTIMMLIILGSLFYEEYMTIRIRQIELENAKNINELKKMESENNNNNTTFEKNSSRLKKYDKENNNKIKFKNDQSGELV